jgi:hypothetical protein
MSKYTAYLLTDETKRRLMARFAPTYPSIKADHITHRYPTDDFADLHWADRIEVIGVADDKNGLQALLIRVDGETERPDGNPYHITWSLDPDRLVPPFMRDEDGAVPYESKHSNIMIKHMLDRNDGKVSCRWLDEPFAITAMPAHVERRGPGDRVINILPKKPGAGYAPWGSKSHPGAAPQ